MQNETCRFFYLRACLGTKTHRFTPELLSVQRQCNMFSKQNNNTVNSVSNKHLASIKIKQCHPQAQLCLKSNRIWRIRLRCAVDHMWIRDLSYSLWHNFRRGVAETGLPSIIPPQTLRQRSQLWPEACSADQDEPYKPAELPIRPLKHVGGIINRLVPDPTGRPPNYCQRGTKLAFYSIAPHDAALLHLCFQKRRAEVDVCDTAWMKYQTEIWRRKPKKCFYTMNFEEFSTRGLERAAFQMDSEHVLYSGPSTVRFFLR